MLCGFLFEITTYAGHNTLSHRPQTVSQAYDSGDPIDVWRLQLEPERTTRPRYSICGIAAAAGYNGWATYRRERSYTALQVGWRH